MATVYHINKGINKPIVFKGLKAQYIAYLAVALVLLLILFAILYICGLSMYIILPVIGGGDPIKPEVRGAWIVEVLRQKAIAYRYPL
jgi:hypothetical protein